MAFDVGCKGKVLMRLLDVPFLLELSGGLTIVCQELDGRSMRVWR